MNNETTNSSIQMISEEIAQLVFEAITQEQILTACSVLLFYVSLLHLDDEVRYIWKPKFKVATFLYLLAKYPLLFLLVLEMGVEIHPVDSLALCNTLGFLETASGILAIIGIQGLILLRTYALCRGHRFMTLAISVTFFIPLALNIYEGTVSLCSPGSGKYPPILNLISNIVIALSDILALLAVIHQIWGLWKEKRSLGLQTHGDFLTLLLQHGILRFSFVLSVSTTEILTIYLFPLAGFSFTAIQNVLSTILTCEFTLALRRRNEQPVPNQSALELPTLSFQDNPLQAIQSVIGRIHESIMSDMGERNTPVEVDSVNQEEQDQETA